MFWHGCNYPWSTDSRTVFYGLDFGANVWGTHVGVSTRRNEVARDFLAMARLGFTIVRWFVFCDGRSGIEFDDRGLPAGTNAHLFVDLDAALELARDIDIRLVLVLLDHRWMFDGIPDVIADPSTGALLEARLPEGRAHVLGTHGGRDALLGNVVEPLVRRYGFDGARADLGSRVFAFEFHERTGLRRRRMGTRSQRTRQASASLRSAGRPCLAHERTRSPSHCGVVHDGSGSRAQLVGVG